MIAKIIKGADFGGVINCMLSKEKGKAKVLASNNISLVDQNLSLETMQVIQCRGLMNQNTEYHERIIELVHQNMKQIQNHTTEYRKSIFMSSPKYTNRSNL